MKGKPSLLFTPLVPVLGMGAAVSAEAQEIAVTAPAENQLDALQMQINQQTRQMEEMRKILETQQNNLARLQQALNEELLADARAKGAPAPVLVPSMAAQAPAQQAPMQSRSPAYSQADDTWKPVGEAPASDSRPPEVAQIFDQPGVLTPRGRFTLEPSLQYGYSANDRVALVGYTIIPALLIGLIDVRQVKTTTATATLTARYGVSNRWELEARVPYVYVNGDTVSREIFTGAAQDNVFNASGNGLGDVEFTARYQINQGGPDKPFYIGWLRYKSRTGRDLFEVTTDCVTRCIGNTTGTGLPLELPTGSGFEAIQPGITWLFPSDPVVFFGSFSYLHNFKRTNVSRTLINGEREDLGEIEAGDILGFNVGMGLSLNEKAAISIGYDQSTVGKTKQNGEYVAGGVRITLGTLLLGATYRLNQKTSLNFALGVGVTRDTPDVTFTMRVPITF